MSEVEEVRKALNRLATRNGGSEAQLLAALKAMKPGGPGISFDVGPSLSKIEAAIVSEGLAACDEYDTDTLQGARQPDHDESVRLEVYASILRKAGLLQ